MLCVLGLQIRCDAHVLQAMNAIVKVPHLCRKRFVCIQICVFLIFGLNVWGFCGSMQSSFCWVCLYAPLHSIDPSLGLF